MRRVLPVLLLAVLSLPLPGAPAASQGFLAPPNDDVERALPLLTERAVVAEPTWGATVQAGEPLPCGLMGSTVWFTYRSDAGGWFTVDTGDSTFDTVLAAYAGSPFAPTLLECNDDSYLGAASRVVFYAYPGQTVYLQAGGAEGAQGALVLHAGPVLY